MKPWKVMTCALVLGTPAVALAQTAPRPEQDKPSAMAPSSAKSVTDQAKPTPQPKRQLNEIELTTLVDVHKLNQGEISMGQLAATKGSSPEIKSYGQHLVNDHKRNDEKLTTLAKRRGVQLASMKPSPKQAEQGKKEQAVLARLKGLSGQEFDTQFALAMIDGHQTAIANVQQALNSCEDTDLRTFLEETLPSLTNHLNQAQRLAKPRTVVSPAPTPTKPQTMPAPMP